MDINTSDVSHIKWAVKHIYLACYNSWREALKFAVLIKEPGHDSAISIHIWGWYVLLWSNHILDGLQHNKGTVMTGR